MDIHVKGGDHMRRRRLRRLRQRIFRRRLRSKRLNRRGGISL